MILFYSKATAEVSVHNKTKKAVTSLFGKASSEWAHYVLTPRVLAC